MIHRTKSLLRIAFLLSLLFNTYSCSSEIDVVDNTFFSSQAELKDNIQGTLLMFNADAGRATLEINCNKDCQAELSNNRASSWCSISLEPVQRGTSKLTVTVEANSSYEERSASIMLSYKDKKETIRVVQKQNDALLVSSAKVEFSEKGGDQSLTLRHNIDYTISVDDQCRSWLSVVKTKALSTDNIVLRATENEEIVNREGKIWIKSDVGDELVYIYQSGATPTMLLSQESYSVSDEGDVVTIEVKSNVGFEYDIIEGAEWIEEVITKSMSTHTLHFSVDKNTEFKSRSGVILFSNTEFGQVSQVTITQIPSQAEKKILLEIMDACDVPEWKNMQVRVYNWEADIPLSEWKGVLLNENGRIESLSFNNYYPGDIPGSIGRLKDLRVFNIIWGGNDFGSYINSFPDSLCLCDNLEEIRIINVSHGGIKEIPDDISNLKKLRVIDLTRSKFDSFPEALLRCTNIEELILPECGINTIPKSITKLNNLRVLKLSLNPLNSLFPEFLCELNNLEELYLSDSDLFGPIPECIGKLKKLKILDLTRLTAHNHLSGNIPNSLLSLPCWQAFPFEILNGNDIKCLPGDFVAPSFDVVDIEGNQLISSDIYKNNKYTIIYPGIYPGMSNGRHDVPPEFYQVYEEYSNDIKLIAFSRSDVSEEYVRDFKDQYKELPFACVKLTKDMIINGQSGHFGIGGHNVAFGESIIVDSAGKVIYWGGIGTIDNIYSFIAGDNTLYESADYTQDKSVITLQSASEGNGIDIILLGDAYSDRDVDDGTYMSDMYFTMEAFFEEEPYKTFRHLFNVYSVIAVSKNNVFDYDFTTQTAFHQKVVQGREFSSYDNEIIKDYALLAVNGNQERLNHSTIIFITNGKQSHLAVHSHCRMGDPLKGTKSISYCWNTTNEKESSYTVKHEAGGHGFGALLDEYVAFGGTWEELKKDYHNLWRGRNVDMTNDSSQIIWSHFLNDPRYSKEVGIWGSGFYRATSNNIMLGRGTGFNAPSREEIYYRIHKMAFGDEWEYDFEKFVEYDLKNIQITTPSMTKKGEINDFFDIREISAPPIIVFDR